jgi:hypothetical protein
MNHKVLNSPIVRVDGLIYLGSSQIACNQR